MTTERWSAAIGVGALAYALFAVTVTVTFFTSDLWLGPTPPPAIDISDDDSRATAAAEGAWRATRVVAYLAALQFGLGALGVYLLAKTLDETREALRETREATRATRDTVRVARASGAAYVYARFTLDRGGAIHEPKVVVRVGIENVGGTPARDVVATVFVIDDSQGETSSHVLADSRRVGVVGAGAREPVGKTSFKAREALAAEIVGPKFVVLTRIAYKTVFEDDDVQVTQEGAYFDVVEDLSDGTAALSLGKKCNVTMAVYEGDIDLRDTLRRDKEEREHS